MTPTYRARAGSEEALAPCGIVHTGLEKPVQNPWISRNIAFRPVAA